MKEKYINNVMITLMILTGVLLTVNACGGTQQADDGHDHDEHAESESDDGHDHGGSAESEEAHDHDEHAESESDDGHDHGGSAESDDGHGHGEHEESGGAEFAEGKGLLVHEEARKMIDLKTDVVKEENLAASFSTTARVFKVTAAKNGNPRVALATAIIPTKNAEGLRKGGAVEVGIGSDARRVTGTVVQLDTSTTKAIELIEAIVEIPDETDSLHFGNFVKMTFHGESRNVFAMPRSAFLAAATGGFAYIKKGERFLRTPVKVGTSTENMIEVTDGLRPGDVVVSQGVVDLWLIELRFTKGGGHSH